MSIPFTNRSPAVPRRVVLFGVLLSLSLAFLGIVGSYLVASLNGEYQEIVNKQLPSLAVVREITQANANGRRLIEGLPLSLEAHELALVRGRIAEIRDENSLRLARLEGLLDSEEGRRLIAQLRVERRSYHQRADNLLEALAKGVEVEERERWRAEVERLDGAYVQAQDLLADYCSRSATSRSDDLTRRSRHLTLFFLLVAAWPLILGVGFFMFGLASTLVLFYRSRR